MGSILFLDDMNVQTWSDCRTELVEEFAVLDVVMPKKARTEDSASLHVLGCKEEVYALPGIVMNVVYYPSWTHGQ
jgi:hypothetical protein